MAFGKNVALGNDTKMQGLLAKLEKQTKTEGRIVGAETLVEAKNTGKGVQAIQESMTEQSAAMTQQTTAMAALQLSANEVGMMLERGGKSVLLIRHSNQPARYKTRCRR